MTSAVNNPKIQQLLAYISSRASGATEQIDAVEYNWRQPHHFNPQQLKKLEAFTAKTAQACSEKFTQHYNSEFTVAVVSTTQYFGGEFIASGNTKSDYCLAFGPDQKQIFGFVGIPAKAAITWTTQLLGDNKPTEEARELSELENSLLLDIVTSVVEAFSSSYESCKLHPAAEFVRGEIPIKLKEDDEICKIAFGVEKSGSGRSSEVYFLMLSDKLEVVTGQNLTDRQDVSPKESAKAMLGHVHKVPVTITAQLASTEITFEEISSLDAGDILLLDKKVNSPVELIAAGKTLFRGRLAKSDEKQAIVITELVAQNK